MYLNMLSTLHICLILGCFQASYGQSIYTETIDGISFDHVEPSSLYNITEGGRIRHMELDLFKPGFILYAQSFSLSTLDYQTSTSHLIAGSASEPGYREGVGPEARFNSTYRTAFHQPNATHVILLDNSNGCVRVVSRLSNATSTLAGQCQNKGYIDGAASEARFGRLGGGIAQRPGTNELLISDMQNDCIRKIDMDTLYVSTLIEANSPRAIAFDPTGIFLYYTLSQHIMWINLDTREQVFLNRDASKQHYDGPVNSSRFSNIVPDIHFLTDKLLVVADQFHDSLRLVDLHSGSVSSICKQNKTNWYDQTTGNISQCELTDPNAILPLPAEEKILIGGQLSIGVLHTTGMMERLCAGEDKPHQCEVITTSTEEASTTQIANKSPPWKTELIVVIVIGTLLMVIIPILVVAVIIKRRKRANLTEKSNEMAEAAIQSNKEDPNHTYEPMIGDEEDSSFMNNNKPTKPAIPQSVGNPEYYVNAPTSPSQIISNRLQAQSLGSSREGYVDMHSGGDSVYEDMTSQSYEDVTSQGYEDMKSLGSGNVKSTECEAEYYQEPVN